MFLFSSVNLMAVSGFVAAYAGGIALGVRDGEFRERMRGFGEADGAQFSLFVFLIFGLIMLRVASPLLDWRAVAYALLSLTLV